MDASDDIVTAADRMLVQVYSRVTPLQQQPISPSVNRAPRAPPVSSMPASLRALLYPEIEREPETEDNTPFVYCYDDDGVDEGLEDAPEDDAEPLSPEPLSDETRTALDLEQRANEIFAEYLKAIAETSYTVEQNTGPPCKPSARLMAKQTASLACYLASINGTTIATTCAGCSSMTQ